MFWPSFALPKRDTPEGITITTLRSGKGSALKSGDKVSVYYSLTLPDSRTPDAVIDRNFDFSTFTQVEYQPQFQFEIDDEDGVILGFNIAMKEARVGDILEIVIPSSLGYGPKQTGDIPKDSTLKFTVMVMGSSASPGNLPIDPKPTLAEMGATDQRLGLDAAEKAFIANKPVQAVGTELADQINIEIDNISGLYVGLSGKDRFTLLAGYASKGDKADVITDFHGTSALWNALLSDWSTNGWGLSTMLLGLMQMSFSRAGTTSSLLGGMGGIGLGAFSRDIIDLSAMDADKNTFGDQAFRFIGDNPFSSVGQVRYENGLLQGNFSGATNNIFATDFELVLINAPRLMAESFIL